MNPLGTRLRRGATALALVTALLAAALAATVPSAQALDSGPYSISGTVSFDPSAPSNVRAKYDDTTYVGVYFTLFRKVATDQYVDYGTKVAYNATNGSWQAAGLPAGEYVVWIGDDLPGNGVLPGRDIPNVTLSSTNANASVGDVHFAAQGRLNVVAVSCETALSASAIYAENTVTRERLQVQSGQSGEVAPNPRCAGGADYANYYLQAPGGNYIVSFEQKGITEYYAGSDVGTLDKTKATPVAVQNWQGSKAQMMYGLAHPIASTTPTISGANATVGTTLAVNAGAWTAGAARTIQWNRNGAPIAGAKAATYRLTAADAAKRITVTVTGTKTGYWPAKRTSAAVLKTGQPTIVGTARVGKILTARPGAWTAGTAFKYQWLRNGVRIAGATKATYRIVRADLGKRIRVVVTGVKAGYATKARTSGQTALVRR